MCEGFGGRAGIIERDFFKSEDRGVWDRTIAANLTTAYDMSVAFLRQVERGESPARIVLTSSMVYRRGAIGGADAATMCTDDIVEYKSASYCGDCHFFDWSGTLGELAAYKPQSDFPRPRPAHARAMIRWLNVR